MIGKNLTELEAMRITSKGQVTIPQEIREKLGLLPHTEVMFEIDGTAVRIRRVGERGSGRGRRLTERMRGRAAVKMSTDEIMALTRGR
jgi:AbrB family looped-hinge helix DNA binding protein